MGAKFVQRLADWHPHGRPIDAAAYCKALALYLVNQDWLALSLISGTKVEKKIEISHVNGDVRSPAVTQDRRYMTAMRIRVEIVSLSLTFGSLEEPLSKDATCGFVECISDVLPEQVVILFNFAFRLLPVVRP
jgi:hypothetical protein